MPKSFNLTTDSIFEPFPKWQGLLAVLLTFPLLVLMPPGRADMAWASAASLAFVTRTFWPLRRERWFWTIMAGMGATQAATIILYPWLAVSQPNWIVGLGMLADIVLISALVIAAATIIRRKRKSAG
jgi:hypothetical protein